MNLELFGELDSEKQKSISTELWLSVVGYEGIYEISNFANVRGVDRISPHPKGALSIKGKILKVQLTAEDYYRVGLCKNGTVKPFLVHRLVAQAFLLNGGEFKEVNHIDGNRRNGSVSNLEWCDRNINMKNAVDRGMFHGRLNVRNTKKLTSKMADEIKEAADSGVAYREIGKAFNIAITTVHKIRCGKLWSLPMSNGSLRPGWVGT